MTDQEPTNTAATKPEQKGSTPSSLQVPTSQPVPHRKGHAPQPSVGIAASLFGSGGDDDPFSAISSGSNAPDPFSASLDQVQEADEEAEPAEAASAPADPVSELFGSMSLAPSSLSALKAQDNATTHTDASTAVPATPGGLFAESGYQDDWLQAGANEQGASVDPFVASDGGQGSLSWVNGSTHDSTDYYSQGVNAVGTYDQQNDHAYDAGYSTQSYGDQELDAYGRPIGSLDYSDNGQYDNQQGYYPSEAYEAHSSSYAPHSYDLNTEVKGYDNYAYAQQPQTHDDYSAHVYDAPPQSHNPQAYAPPQQSDRYAAYDYSATRPPTDSHAMQADYSIQSQGQQSYASHASPYDLPAQQSYESQNHAQTYQQPSFENQAPVYGSAKDNYAQPSSYQSSSDQEVYLPQQPLQPFYDHQDSGQPSYVQQYGYDGNDQIQQRYDPQGYDFSDQQNLQSSADGPNDYDQHTYTSSADDTYNLDQVSRSQDADQQLGEGGDDKNQPDQAGPFSRERAVGSLSHEEQDKPQDWQEHYDAVSQPSQHLPQRYPSILSPEAEDRDTVSQADVQADPYPGDENHLHLQQSFEPLEQRQNSTSFADQDSSYADESTLNPYGHTHSVYADNQEFYRDDLATPSLEVFADNAPNSATPTPQHHDGKLASPTVSNSGRYAPYNPLSGLANPSNINHQTRDVSTGSQHGPYGSEADDGGYFGGGITQSSPHVYGQTSNYDAPLSPYPAAAPSGSRSVTDDAEFGGSLEGTNDLLRTMQNARIPLAAFGIGGKLVTYFPSAVNPKFEHGDVSADSTYGSYAYNASSHSTSVTVQPMSRLIPSSSYASLFDPISFPGPAFDGLGSATTLSRATGGASANKTKKAGILKHLEERIQDLSAGIGYLRRRPSFNSMDRGSNNAVATPQTAAELESRRVEDKVLLLQLLMLLVENDGQTTTLAFEQGVRALIVPNSPSATGFGTAMSVSGSEDPSGTLVRSYELKTTFLQKLQSMLLRGERREAVDYAVSQRMWAHAMTISSCVDKDCWKVVVGQFIEQELGLAETKLTGQGDLQGLKVAYNVFSGQDPVSIFDLFRTKTQLHPQSGLQPPAEQSSASLPSWKEAAAIVSSNKSPTDAAALTAIGDGLSTRGLVEAAHFCYLLSPQSSPMGGADTAAIRFSLLGLPNPKTSTSFSCDLDGIMMTEVLEYAQGLVPVAKGQESFAGIPHLQAYKLVHAHALAELGDVAKAQKYCEAIAYSLKLCKNSPYLHSTLLTELKQLSDRLVGAPHRGPGGNWVTRKMQRPTLDGVWGALEGRFTKFIAGEDGSTEADSPSRNNKGSNGSSLGPFSHYSAITPDAASGGITRQQSFTDVRGPSPSVPSSRSGSAMDFRGASKRAASPKHRASSALAMRSMTDDWFQSGQPPPHFLGHDGSGIGPGSSRTSFEAHRNGAGHGFQSSEYSQVSSTYEGLADTSYASDNAHWLGGRSSNVAHSQGSASETHEDRSNAGEQHGGFGGYGGYQGSYSNSAAGDGEVDYNEGASGAPGNVPFYGYQPHGAQKPQFVSNVDSSALDGEAGFVSPFDALSSHSQTPQPQTNNYAPSSWNQTDSRKQNEEDVLDDDDDLGLGNANNSKKAVSNTADSKDRSDDDNGDVSRNSAAASGDGGDKDGSTESTGDKRQELKSSASWFGRLWGRSASTDPVTAQAQAKAKKAHLGEEVTFYYDQELKRWVNKKAGDTGAASSPPPPPPRAQTASPASQPDRNVGTSSAPPMRRQVSAGEYSSQQSGSSAPPQRAASAAYTVGRSTPPISEGQDEGSSGLAPSRGPVGMAGLSRARSNLADHSMPPAAQPPLARSGSGAPASSTPPPPPAGGSKTGTVKKRPIKSRYVVVD